MHLERFSTLKSPLQAKHAHKVVTDPEDDLKNRNPGALTRYGSYPRALWHIGRLARFGEGFNAFLVKEQFGIYVPAIGMATIIMNQAVAYERAGEQRRGAMMSGVAVDYWLSRESDGAHSAAAQAVTSYALGMSEDESRLFTVEPSHDELPTGFRDRFNPVSNPEAPVIRVQGNPLFGVVPKGPAQLFAYSDVPPTPSH